MLKTFPNHPVVFSAIVCWKNLARSAHFCHVSLLHKQRGSRTSFPINHLVTTTTTTAASQISTARAVHTMSSSEGEDFAFDEVDNASDSDGYAPEPAAKKVRVGIASLQPTRSLKTRI